MLNKSRIQKVIKYQETYECVVLINDRTKCLGIDNYDRQCHEDFFFFHIHV